MRPPIEALCLLGLFACCGCASEPPPPRVAPPPQPEAQKAVPLVAKTSSELGSVDPDAVKRAFGQLNDKFMDCQKRALDRLEVLAGNAKFFLRIGAGGTAKWAYLE